MQFHPGGFPGILDEPGEPSWYIRCSLVLVEGGREQEISQLAPCMPLAYQVYVALYDGIFSLQCYQKVHTLLK